jgi:hypothetical protein
MSHCQRATTLKAPSNDESRALSTHCQDLLSSLPRSDQRRASEAYVAGLLQCPGKKSIRRIASTSVRGFSDQSLQQFVNQSAWDPDPVRQRLATWLTDRSAPRAWVVGEVAFTKNGRHSAGVERQFSRATGRLVNCQVGVFVALSTEDGVVPVNWRLSIPRSWDTDELRRRKARVPPDERHQPPWRYQMEALDDLSGDWGVPLAPVVLDQPQSMAVAELAHALDDRGLPFLVRASSMATVRDEVLWSRPRCGAPASQRGTSLGEVIAALASLPRRTVSWLDPVNARQVRAQFTCARVRLMVPNDGAGCRSVVPRLLVLEWGLGKREPRAAWLSNVLDRDLDELVALTREPARAGVSIATMTDRLGLRDYEGRSFIGWHHHVTLASVAYAFHVSTSADVPRTGVGADPPPPSPQRTKEHQP